MRSFVVVRCGTRDRAREHERGLAVGGEGLRRVQKRRLPRQIRTFAHLPIHVRVLMRGR
jgi:hypothetical protein